jgi:phospholipid/cholesterol/gamma-HCH transport system ATP-binding protein
MSTDTVASSCSKTRNPFTGAEADAVSVKVDGLSKKFGSLSVLKSVSFDVTPGEIFVIMGPSGSGKSVLLRHIAGLEAPTAGKVTIDGLDPSLEETRDRVRLALVFQAGALFNSLSVYDNLALYPREHRSGDEKAIRQRVMHALQILSVEKAANQFPAELSGGMKKRVSIARALVMEPQLLLYDEPTSELDPVMSATISEIIATLKNEYSVTSVVVTHDRSLALTISDRVGILMAGKMITLGTPDELKKSQDPRITDFLNPSIDVNHPRFKTLEEPHDIS